MDLGSKELSYIVISSNKIDPIVSYLYSKDYKLLEIKNFHEGIWGDSIICWGQLNEDIVTDVSRLVNEFDHDSIIVKLEGSLNAKRILKNGSNIDLDLIMYNTDSNLKSYLHNGISFSFSEKKKYSFPSKKSDFKVGMVVECYSNRGEWVKRTVEDVDLEYLNIYSTLLKYNRVRI